MSHVVKLTVKFLELESMKVAAVAVGLEFIEGVGSIVADTAYDESRAGKVEHIMRLPQDQIDAVRKRIQRAPHTIGVTRDTSGEGWNLAFDSYGSGWAPVQEKVGPNCATLLDEYGAAVMAEEYTRQGYQVSREVMEDGAVKVVAYQA